MNGISCHNLLLNLVLLGLSGVRCHLPNVDLGTPLHCCAVNGSPEGAIPEEPGVHSYFDHLHRHCFYADEPEHTADCAHHNSSARAFNLLKFALKPEEEEEEVFLSIRSHFSNFVLIEHVFFKIFKIS